MILLATLIWPTATYECESLAFSGIQAFETNNCLKNLRQKHNEDGVTSGAGSTGVCRRILIPVIEY